MAQLNITLNQDEILELLAKNSGEAFKKLLQESLNSILQAVSGGIKFFFSGYFNLFKLIVC